MARKSNYQVCRDHNGRTCIKLAESQGLVQFIPMADLGFDVETTSIESFNQRYKPMPDYPINKACQLFLNYCTVLGATDEVLDYLAAEITVTQEDREMAASKREATPAKEKPAKKEKAAPKKRAVKSAPKKPGSTTKPKAKAAVKKTKAKADGEYKSAAQMFQALIMAGKQTDDEIFAEVQSAFGLDDSKRSYVKWYRNNLKKKGENPPEPKGA